ncbi:MULTISPECIES: integrase core domain-containing protein [unclassified Nonomuraea]|uniref:integrase core domain-containing protein n=1 Tax=unclassified Nonomuraea TaxID=2593643 RepID=UPI0033CFCFF2
MLGRPLIDVVTDPATGQIRPVTVVTDNGPAFKSIAFARFFAAHPELKHVRTRKKSPHTNGVRERAFGSLKYERLYREEIPDGPTLALNAHAYRAEFNTQRPHEGIAMNRPIEVYLGQADPTTPNFSRPETLPPS